MKIKTNPGPRKKVIPQSEQSGILQTEGSWWSTWGRDSRDWGKYGAQREEPWYSQARGGTGQGAEMTASLGLERGGQVGVQGEVKAQDGILGGVKEREAEMGGYRELRVHSEVMWAGKVLGSRERCMPHSAGCGGYLPGTGLERGGATGSQRER